MGHKGSVAEVQVAVHRRVKSAEIGQKRTFVPISSGHNFQFREMMQFTQVTSQIARPDNVRISRADQDNNHPHS